MGFKFNAIAIQGDYKKNDIDQLSLDFECAKLEFKSEILQQDAILNYDEQGAFLDIGFFENGLLIFVSDKFPIKRLNLKKASFKKELALITLNATTNFAAIHYYHNMKSVLELMQLNHRSDLIQEEDYAIDHSDGFDLGIKVISRILKRPFYEIEANEPFYRFKLSRKEIQLNSAQGAYLKEREAWIQSKNKSVEIVEEEVQQDLQLIFKKVENYKFDLNERKWLLMEEKPFSGKVSIAEVAKKIFIDGQNFQIDQKTGTNMWSVSKEGQSFTCFKESEKVTLVNMEEKKVFYL